MGLIKWIMDKDIRPNNAKERTYAILGKKLMDQDSEIYNNYIDALLNNLETKLKFFFSSLTFYNPGL